LTRRLLKLKGRRHPDTRTPANKHPRFVKSHHNEIAPLLGRVAARARWSHVRSERATAAVLGTPEGVARAERARVCLAACTGSRQRWEFGEWGPRNGASPLGKARGAGRRGSISHCNFSFVESDL